MSRNVLNYASPHQVLRHRQPLFVCWSFVSIQLAGLLAGLPGCWWVLSDNGFARLVTSPVVGFCGAIQLFAFTIPGWKVLRKRSELPWWGILLAGLIVSSGAGLSFFTCWWGLRNVSLAPFC